MILEKVEKLKKNEAAAFAEAYANLDKKYHGFLSSFPVYVKIWEAAIPEGTLKKIKDNHNIKNCNRLSSSIISFLLFNFEEFSAPVTLKPMCSDL